MIPTSNLYVFPLSMRSAIEDSPNFPHISFEILQRKLPENATIHLYAPTGISISDSAEYNNVDLGVIGGTVKSAAESGAGSVMDGMSGADVKDAAIALGKKAKGDVMGIGSALEIARGVASNPRTAVQFNNVGIRTFNFTFKLIAESQKEQEQIFLIENMFRRALYPEANGDLFLQYPSTFQIKFNSGGQENQYLPKIFESYLTSMTATYNNDSNMYHADGSPGDMDLALTFQETAPLTRDKMYGSSFDTTFGSESDPFGINKVRTEIENKLNKFRNRF
jgi:hypothetical protein